MTDLKPQPFHTRLTDAFTYGQTKTDRELRAALAEALAAKQQAEDAQAIAETETERANEARWRVEQERDGIEQLWRNDLAEHVRTRAAELGYDSWLIDPEPIVDDLVDARRSGTTLDQIGFDAQIHAQMEARK